ncbi:translation initiation factor IF-2-like [Phacochoerus africanus]|uniref:translation initiation factor IF-2-like n=1 Tax=Phacochoerus africanus TaxID=41426 RepID=UPI001FDAB229|nr:translation initiation factor IF-2-like [Phacochoerus africanus]
MKFCPEPLAGRTSTRRLKEEAWGLTGAAREPPTRKRPGGGRTRGSPRRPPRRAPLPAGRTGRAARSAEGARGGGRAPAWARPRARRRSGSFVLGPPPLSSVGSAAPAPPRRLRPARLHCDPQHPRPVPRNKAPTAPTCPPPPGRSAQRGKVSRPAPPPPPSRPPPPPGAPASWSAWPGRARRTEPPARAEEGTAQEEGRGSGGRGGSSSSNEGVRGTPRPPRAAARARPGTPPPGRARTCGPAEPRRPRRRPLRRVRGYARGEFRGGGGDGAGGPRAGGGRARPDRRAFAPAVPPLLRGQSPGTRPPSSGWPPPPSTASAALAGAAGSAGWGTRTSQPRPSAERASVSPLPATPCGPSSVGRPRCPQEP